MDSSIIIKFLTEPDLPIMVKSFAEHSWPKPFTTFEKYLKEQREKERLIWVAYDSNQFAGYITLKWNSQYKFFHKKNVPEIMDLNVPPPFRGKGIGLKLLEIAEQEAAKKYNIVGIGVGLYNDYGSAQRLYIKHGYIPDGQGVTYNYKSIEPGSNVILDDDLVLWFTKKLKE